MALIPSECMIRSSVAIGPREWKLRPQWTIWKAREKSFRQPLAALHSFRSPISTTGTSRSFCWACLMIAAACRRRQRPDRSRCMPNTASSFPSIAKRAMIAPRGSRQGMCIMSCSSSSTDLRTSRALPCQPMESVCTSSGIARKSLCISSNFSGIAAALAPNRRSASCKAMISASISLSTSTIRPGLRRRSVPMAL